MYNSAANSARLKNVPAYSQRRRSFHASAAACTPAMHAVIPCTHASRCPLSWLSKLSMHVWRGQARSRCMPASAPKELLPTTH